MNNKTHFIIIGGFFFVLGITFSLLASGLNENQQKVLNNTVADILKAQDNAQKIAEPYLRVETQNPTDKIIISYVDFNSNTFVVIKKPGMYGGEELMGVSKLLSAGKNTNIEIPLTAKVTGTILTAYLFKDNGDEVFNETNDSKALDPRNNLLLCQNFDIRTKVINNAPNQ